MNEMTAKEAVKQIKGNCYFASISEKTKEALDMAIKALEQQQDVHDTCIEDYPTCTECEHYDREKHYCPRFCQVIKDTLAEAQPTEGDLISRKDVITALIDADWIKTTAQQAVIAEVLNKIPSVKPKKGKWIVFRCGDTDTFKCSECGMRVVNPYKYCPNCGSYNGGGEDGEDSAFD